MSDELLPHHIGHFESTQFKNLRYHDTLSILQEPELTFHIRKGLLKGLPNRKSIEPIAWENWKKGIKI